MKSQPNSEPRPNEDRTILESLTLVGKIHRKEKKRHLRRFGFNTLPTQDDKSATRQQEGPGKFRGLRVSRLLYRSGEILTGVPGSGGPSSPGRFFLRRFTGGAELGPFCLRPFFFPLSVSITARIQ